MPRPYFVETSALAGLTFFSDRWFREVKPLHDRGYPLHTSELALTEYCGHDEPTSLPPEDPSRLNPDWESEAGLFRTIENNLKRPLPDYLREIRKASRDGLDLDDAIERFIDQFGIREQAEPQIRAAFNDHFEERAVTAQYVGNFARDLVDRILTAAVENKRRLSKAVTVHPSVYHKADDTRRQWSDFPKHPPHEPDISILVDATELSTSDQFSHFVTGDSDLLALQPVANEYYGLTIISMADEFAPTGICLLSTISDNE